MKITALAGGVGGAKLADGLALALPNPADLTVIVNTGDDMDFLNVRICPDLDTVCYTLSGLGNPVTGWGRDADTYHMLEEIDRLGGPTWFRLGDRDFATHVERTRRLSSGDSLSKITADFCRAWKIAAHIIPMTDRSVATRVYTKTGEVLAFQEYFVHRHCEPEVTGFDFAGIDAAIPAPGVIEAIQEADFIVICPSNPWVSIDPILSIPGVQNAIKSKIVVAVSPLIGGKAVKGPVAKMYSELGLTPTAKSVAKHYHEILNGFILDQVDQAECTEINGWGIMSMVSDIMMLNREDRRRLAMEVIDFAIRIGGLTHL